MDALDALGCLFRSTWHFRGKYRLAHLVAQHLPCAAGEGAARVVKMWDGTSMKVDFRSLMERVPFWTGEYERASIGRLVSWLNEDSVVVDAGANIGFYSIGLGRLLKAGGGKVYAFEPVPANYERLVQNVALNALERVVMPYRLALGDAEGEVNLGMEESDGAKTGNAVLIKEKDGDRATSVTAPMTTLDAFAERHGLRTCTFLKVDVEGAEVLLLRGAARFIQKCRPVIYGEFNNYFLPKMGFTFVDAANLIAPLGYRMFIEQPLTHSMGSGDRGGIFVPIDVVRPGLEQVLMVPEETPRDSLLKLGIAP